MDVVYQNGSYRISYNGIAMIENALGNPNLIQISVSSACTVTPNPLSYDLAYLPNGEYRTWTLSGVNTKLNNAGEHFIYARLSRTDDSAIVLFSLKDYKFSGKVSDDETSKESTDYYYLKIGSITATDSATSSATVKRSITLDFGYFTSPKGDQEATGSDMFELLKTSTPWLIRAKYYLSSFTVKGLITLLGGLVFKGDDYEKPVTNLRTSLDTDETCPISDETIPSTKWVISVTEDKFIRKDKDDQTKYLLSLLGGAIIKKWLKIGDFVTGITGGYIDEIGNGELESLVLRDHLSVPEIRYNRMTYFEGYNLISPGGGFTVMEVTDNGDGSYTIVPELEEGEPIGQFTDDILLGYWHEKNATGDFAGFQKVQFRVTEVDYTEKWCKLSPRPGTNAAPLKNMRLGQTGNFTNEERQTYIIIDTRDGNNCITFMDNANTWDPEPAQMKSWFGKKKGMNVQGIDCDNYSAVLQNILCVGNYFQVDQITGDKVRVPCDKGAWSAGEYAYYDRVTHNGCLWLCVNDKGTTTSEPSDNNPDWLKQVDRGTGLKSEGEWSLSGIPYPEGTIISMGPRVFISKKETSLPPIAIYMTDEETYAMTDTGAYVLMGSWEESGNPDDWELMLDMSYIKDGTGYEFQGAFPVAPENPQEGWTYYNSTDKCTYVFQNGGWQVMVFDGKDGTDYEWIYQRTKTEEDKPAQPMSANVDDYVPPGWTDDPTGVDEEWIYEWACKRIKTDGVWGDFSNVALCYKYGSDGEGFTASGDWSHAKVPYKKGDVVYFGGSSYVALKETSNPPIAIFLMDTGKYAMLESGAYACMGTFDTAGYKEDWQLVAKGGDNGADAESYWLDCPVSVINFSMTGHPSPSSFLVTCKASVRGSVIDYGDLYLVARKYKDGEGWTTHTGPVRASSIGVSALAGYTQFSIRAYKAQADATAWNDNFLAEKGVGVAKDGATGEQGKTGAFPRDRGIWKSGQKYVWDDTNRDHIIHPFSGVYYNFLVKNYGSTVTAAPTSASGDSNWQAMNQYESIATDTLFADGANVANFMFKDGVLRSQQETNGTPNCILNGNTGYFFCNYGEFSGELKSPTGKIGGFMLSSDKMVATGTVYNAETVQTLKMELDYTGMTFTSNGAYASKVVIGSTYMELDSVVNRYAINVKASGIGAYGINVETYSESGIAMNIENGIVMGLREYFYQVSTIRTSTNPYELSNVNGTVFVSVSSETHLRLPTSPKDGTTICVRKTGTGNIIMHGKLVKPDQTTERPTSETTVTIANAALFIFKYSSALKVWTANYMN